jgi:cobalt-zinc-cadmium efflux system membrane fusion protein
MNLKKNREVGMRMEGADSMDWIKQHMALVSLLVLVGAGAVLFATGTLQFRQSDRQETAKTGKNPSEEDTSSATNPSRVQGDNVVLDEDAFRTSGIRIAPVNIGSVPMFFEAPGEVQLAEDRIAHITPQIAGIIRVAYKGVGDRVAKGSPLCLIESVELGDARASYVAAHAEMELTERNYSRWKQLYDKGLRTQNELIAADAELTRAKLKMEASASRLRGLGITTEEIRGLEKEGSGAVGNQYTLRSPITGSILQRTATTGQGVTSADQIFFVADLSEMWVQAVAREQDLPAIKTGASAVVRIPNMPEVALHGKITYIGEQVDEKTRTVPLRVLVRNSEKRGGSQKEFLLRPGLFTNIQIETGRKKDVSLIPFAAVQADGNETYVFVRVRPPSAQSRNPGAKHEKINPGVAFERRGVELGARDGQMVEVIKGLRMGEQIAVENAYMLKSEMEKSKLQD